MMVNNIIFYYLLAVSDMLLTAYHRQHVYKLQYFTFITHIATNFQEIFIPHRLPVGKARDIVTGSSICTPIHMCVCVCT